MQREGRKWNKLDEQWSWELSLASLDLWIWISTSPRFKSWPQTLILNCQPQTSSPSLTTCFIDMFGLSAEQILRFFRIFCCHFWRVVSLSAEKAQQSRGWVGNRFLFLFCCAPSSCLLHHHSSPLICCPTIGGAILALSILPLSRSVISTTSSCPKREFPTLLFLGIGALCRKTQRIDVQIHLR